MQKRREKLALRQARREEKAKSTSEPVEDPMHDPSIDWGDSVREVKLEPDSEELAGQ